MGSCVANIGVMANIFHGCMNFAGFEKCYICSRAAKLLLWPAMVELFHKNVLNPHPWPIEVIGDLNLTLRWVGSGGGGCTGIGVHGQVSLKILTLTWVNPNTEIILGTNSYVFSTYRPKWSKLWLNLVEDRVGCGEKPTIMSPTNSIYGNGSHNGLNRRVT